MRFVSKITSTTNKPERLFKLFYKKETCFRNVVLRCYSTVPSSVLILSLAQKKYKNWANISCELKINVHFNNLTRFWIGRRMFMKSNSFLYSWESNKTIFPRVKKSRIQFLVWEKEKNCLRIFLSRQRMWRRLEETLPKKLLNNSDSYENKSIAALFARHCFGLSLHRILPTNVPFTKDFRPFIFSEVNLIE